MRLNGFVGPSATSTNQQANCEDTINSFVEIMEPTGEGRAVDQFLAATPGFTARWDLTPGPVRALYREPQTGRVFAVSGYILYELFADFSATNRGSVALDENPARIRANSAVGQLFISSGGVGYCYELGTDTLTTVLSSGCTMIDYLDGRFLSLNAATTTYRISDLNDGLTWDPAQFFTRSQAGDPWVSMLVVNKDIILSGTETTEVHYDAATAPFPFAPRPDVLVQYGTNAPYSLAALNDIPIWLSRNTQGSQIIVRLDGYRATKLSSLPVDVSLHQMPTTTDAVAWSYQQDGHAFYVMNCPTGKVAWAFDAATAMWCKRAFWNGEANEYQAQRVQTHCEAFDLHLVGDRLTGSVYEMSPTTAIEVDGGGIRRLRRFMGPTGEDHHRMVIPRLEIQMQTGGSPLSGQGSAPLGMLRCSDDRGMTWRPELTSSLGERGNYSARVFWTRLGRFRDPAFEFVVSDPIPYQLTQAWIPNVIAGVS